MHQIARERHEEMTRTFYNRCQVQGFWYSEEYVFECYDSTNGYNEQHSMMLLLKFDNYQRTQEKRRLGEYESEYE